MHANLESALCVHVCVCVHACVPACMCACVHVFICIFEASLHCTAAHFSSIMKTSHYLDKINNYTDSKSI